VRVSVSGPDVAGRTGFKCFSVCHFWTRGIAVVQYVLLDMRCINVAGFDCRVRGIAVAEALTLLDMRCVTFMDRWNISDSGCDFIGHAVYR
jgi:hypothetical protein